MRIVVLQDDFPPHHEGGTGVISYQLAKEFAKDGHSVSIITTVQDESLAGRENLDGMHIIRLFSNYNLRYRGYISLYNPAIIEKTKQLLKELNPDIVHVHNVHHYLSYYSIVLARRYAKKVYMTAHDCMSFYFGKPPFTTGNFQGPENPNIFKESIWHQFSVHGIRYNPFRVVFVRLILRRNVDKIIAVSNALKGALNENNIVNVSVIHNGIDVDQWKEPKGVELFKERKGIGDNAILFSGRFSEAKGSSKIINALKIVQEKVPNAQLLVVGKKDFRVKKMLELAHELGVEESLVFTGWIYDIELRKAYYAASVVAVPSLYLDPFPTINLEAFACSRPVVATCFGGSPEIIQDGLNGYVVDPNDEHIMAEKLVDLLSNKSKNSSYGVAGNEHVLNNFTLAQQIKEYKQLFFVRRYYSGL